MEICSEDNLPFVFYMIMTMYTLLGCFCFLWNIEARLFLYRKLSTCSCNIFTRKRRRVGPSSGTSTPDPLPTPAGPASRYRPAPPASTLAGPFFAPPGTQDLCHSSHNTPEVLSSPQHIYSVPSSNLTLPLAATAGSCSPPDAAQGLCQPPHAAPVGPCPLPADLAMLDDKSFPHAKQQTVTFHPLQQILHPNAQVEDEVCPKLIRVCPVYTSE